MTRDEKIDWRSFSISKIYYFPRKLTQKRGRYVRPEGVVFSDLHLSGSMLKP